MTEHARSRQRCAAARRFLGGWRACAALAVVGCLSLAASPLLAQTRDAPASSLRGRVMDARTGRPLADARVVLSPAARDVRTDSAGRFDLGPVVSGPHALTVTAVGYAPARAEGVLAAASPLELDVELERLAPLLDSVVSEASIDVPRNPAMAEFESRRQTGLGRFLTREDLLRDRGRLLDAVLKSRVPGLRVQDGVASSARAGGRIRGSGPCRVNVFVDGVLVYQPLPGKEPFDLRTLEASMVAAVEFYTSASLPSQFNMASNTPCGALVIWLQH